MTIQAEVKTAIKPAKGHVERRMCRDHAHMALCRLRNTFDLPTEAFDLDNSAWSRVEGELADLLFAAYRRTNKLVS